MLNICSYVSDDNVILGIRPLLIDNTVQNTYHASSSSSSDIHMSDPLEFAGVEHRGI